MWANTGNPVPQNDIVSAVFLFTQVDQTDKKRDGCFDKQEKMLTRVCPGYPPFYDDNPFGIYEKILSGKLEWPRHVEMTAKDLVKRLLVHDRTKRLGNMKAGAEDVKKHRSISGIMLILIFDKIHFASALVQVVQVDRLGGGVPAAVEAPHCSQCEL